MKVVATLKRIGQAVASGLTVNIRLQGRHWGGEIALPRGLTVYTGAHQLVLSDGRRGNITISMAPPSGQEGTAYFEGDGALQ